MLKIITLSCLFVAVCSVSNEYQSKAMEKVAGIAAACIEEVSANDNDIGELMQKKIPSRREGKCLLACISKKLNLMKDGKPNREGAIETFASLKADDPDAYAKLFEIMDVCDAEMATLTETDECEIAVKATECFQRICKERGLDSTSVMG